MARRFVLKSDEPAPATSLSIDYKAELNPQQFEVVTTGNGAVLVVAGAGTGKTRTLVYRVAYLVETGTPPENIVLLTFTRRAAREMLTRASALLDGRCNRVQGGTFHAFCLRILREHAPRIGYQKNFSVLDSSDDADVIDVLRAARGLHKSDLRFPKKRKLQTIFSALINQDMVLADLLAEQYPQFLAHLAALEELHEAYQTYKKQHGLMNYDDLLLQTLALLEQDESVRRQVGAKCRHLLVDEYQDTNRLQAELVELFASMHGNVMAVGDDAQSIYRFRGADYRNIFTFAQRFNDARLLKLEENYRSTQPILDLANHLIEQARYKYDKVLFTRRTGGELPAIVAAPDDQYESRFICQMVLELREQDIPLNRMAVLFRSSHNSFDLEVELSRRNIPYVKYGGAKLTEAAHIKDVLAYLRVAENPRDAIAWNRILLLLNGVGPKTAQQLIEWITNGSGEPFVLDDRPFSGKYIEALKGLFGLLQRLHEHAGSVSEQVEAILNYYDPILQEKYYEDYPKRQQDLEHFVDLCEQASNRATFLSTMVLDPIELTAVGTEASRDDEPPLILSTIHSAKGLEFHSVFLLHALDGIIPSGYAIQDEEALDEELRLLYVAVTRAEDNLFISYPVLQHRRRQGDYFSNPSRFIQDVPESLLEPWSLVDESPPPQLHEPQNPPQLADPSDDAQLPF